jgi:multisubunit Na+/H+ antiporter MnhG subunit
MPEIKPLPEAANTAATDSLGILIPDAKNRKLAYALYGLTSLIISNVAVGVLASGIQAPVWLVVSLAIVGNLAAPFSTLAIANASANKK